MIPDQNNNVESGLFTDHELGIIKSISRSKIWRLMRDALCLERERLFDREPSHDNDREIWMREGALRQVQRLLQQGPYLAVYYDRYLREKEANGQQDVATDFNEPPDLSS